MWQHFRCNSHLCVCMLKVRQAKAGKNYMTVMSEVSVSQHSHTGSHGFVYVCLYYTSSRIAQDVGWQSKPRGGQLWQRAEAWHTLPWQRGTHPCNDSQASASSAALCAFYAICISDAPAELCMFAHKISALILAIFTTKMSINAWEQLIKRLSNKVKRFSWSSRATSTWTSAVIISNAAWLAFNFFKCFCSCMRRREREKRKQSCSNNNQSWAACLKSERKAQTLANVKCQINGQRGNSSTSMPCGRGTAFALCTWATGRVHYLRAFLCFPNVLFRLLSLSQISKSQQKTKKKNS